MGSSRLIVKNLPKLTNEEKLRETFSTKGIVTDVQLKYTPEGKFRHFAFVGYKTHEEAEVACSYFNNTYFGASKIIVQHCVTLGDSEKPKAWGKYAVEKEEENKRKRKKDKEEKAKEKEPKKKKTEEIILEKCQEDPGLVEFLEAHRKKSSWGNDTIINELEKQTKSKVVPEVVEDQQVQEDDEAPAKEKKPKKEKSTKNKMDKEFFTIKIRDLPKKARKKEIKAFFLPLKPKSVRIPPNMRGFAYISFLTEEEQKKALKKNKEFILGQKVVLTKLETTKKELEASKQKKEKWEEQTKELEKDAETLGESGRIFLRNLPYTTNEDEIRALFETYGTISEVHLPVDRISRQIKGFGFVSFLFPEHAVAAFNELDGTIYQGRMLHLLPSKQRIEMEAKDSKEGTSFKKAKDVKMKQSAGSSHNWNSLFLGQNAITEVATHKYGVTKEEFLLDRNEERDPKQSVGVRMALAEAVIVEENKQFLEEHGVCLESFNGEKTERSKNTFLAKNLPANTNVHELHEIFSKHGELSQIILPPSGLTAIIEYFEPAEARAAFKKTAYTKFKDLPLYLEWAPINAFIPKKEPSKEELEKAELDEKKAGTKILVKNIPFQATKEEVSELFKTFGEIKALRIPMKVNGSGEHRGFGFVEFHTKPEAKRALITLGKSTHLYGRRLILEWATAEDSVDELRVKTAKKFTLMQAAGKEKELSSTKKNIKRYFDSLPPKKKDSDEEEDE